jgi:hypothetical protein
MLINGRGKTTNIAIRKVGAPSISDTMNSVVRSAKPMVLLKRSLDAESIFLNSHPSQRA